MWILFVNCRHTVELEEEEMVLMALLMMEFIPGNIFIDMIWNIAIFMRLSQTREKMASEKGKHSLVGQIGTSNIFGLANFGN